MPVSAFINEENVEAVRPHSVYAPERQSNKQKNARIGYLVCLAFSGASRMQTHIIATVRGLCGTPSREIRYKILPIKSNVTSCWTRVATECMLGHCLLRVWPRNCTEMYIKSIEYYCISDKCIWIAHSAFIIDARHTHTRSHGRG